MARKKKAQANNNVYWQSEEWNRRSYIMYLDWLTQLAMNRFEWVNLPKGCDARFLEYSLNREGAAIIFKPTFLLGRFFSTKVIHTGPLNVYDNPTRYRSVGNNGWSYPVKTSSGVIVWNSYTRTSIWNTLELYARRLADIDRTLDINLKNQKTPFIITGPEERQNDIIQIYKQLNGNEPAIIGLPSISDVKVDVLNTNVAYIGNELLQTKQQLINEVYTYLGIDNTNTEKKERLITDEVKANSEAVMMRRLDGLNPRRQAANELNEKFGLNIQVVWRNDTISENYLMQTSVKEKAELGLSGGEDV